MVHSIISLLLVEKIEPNGYLSFELLNL